LSAKRTGSKVLALLAGSALALTACATSSGGSGATSGAKRAPITIKLGYAQEFTAYNSNTVDRSALANTLVLNQVLRGFYYFKPDGTLAPDSDFGSYEKTSDNPLTIKYKSTPGGSSDGEPVDCDDIVLTWLANSTLTGDKGFSSSNPAGYDVMNPPACKDGDKEATVTYKTPFADWEGRFNWTSIMPAHIVEAQGGLTKSIVEYATKPKSPDLVKAIDFYNKGWALSPGQLKKDVMPSSGPYLIDSWAAKESITLRANPKWWGTPPKAEKIVIRIIADDHQAQALQNGEIDVMEPQPQVDIVNQLKQQGDKVKVQYSYSYSLEHLDFNFRGAFGDKRLREAFALCVPRQAIVNHLVKPIPEHRSAPVAVHLPVPAAVQRLRHRRGRAEVQHRGPRQGEAAGESRGKDGGQGPGRLEEAADLAEQATGRHRGTAEVLLRAGGLQRRRRGGAELLREGTGQRELRRRAVYLGRGTDGGRQRHHLPDSRGRAGGPELPRLQQRAGGPVVR
jgi:peptide/nickel transport system substrate-binding protein